MNIENYLSNYNKGSKKLNLNAMSYLMDKLGHPEEKFEVIHIAGTNGKGSVTEMIANVLKCEDYTVGKFISPHLIHYNERISVNSENISNNEIEIILKRINPIIEQYNSINDVPITFFELETTIAFMFFEQKKCDFAVLETGLGGALDCTNIVNKPIVSIITSIGYDHMHILGNTLPEIAYQKSGIIKNNSHTVVFKTQKDVDDVFINECEKKNNDLHMISKSDITNYSFNTDFQSFDYRNYKEIRVNLKGKVQVQNACLCLETFTILNELGYKVRMESIRKGLSSVIHKGRMEQLNNNPIIIYDGAHNEPAIENLMDTAKMYYPDKKRVYIISILKRKDYTKMLEKIAEDKDAAFILTSGNNEKRYASGIELYECLKQFNDKSNITIKELREAIEDAMDSDKDTVNFVIGSFYTYGTVTDIIQNLKK